MAREIARNLERIESGAESRVCLGTGGKKEDSCVCHRDAGHDGWHHCPCGAEWK